MVPFFSCELSTHNFHCQQSIKLAVKHSESRRHKKCQKMLYAVANMLQKA